MFENLKNLGGLMKQAQEMGQKMKAVQESLKDKRAEASTGGGLVTVEVNGLGEVLNVKIDPSLVGGSEGGGDHEMIEDLLVGAINQAVAKSKQLHAEAMQEVTGGMNIPGLSDAMKNMGG
ncbi:MAG: YbaB/EbfC family nucleoid-associated protein [Pirellulales bacterium]|nr:YbaB/EbfC family nucleoid-associated protein [Pirellulales bacterium]